jgi:hypothetical protein
MITFFGKINWHERETGYTQVKKAVAVGRGTLVFNWLGKDDWKILRGNKAVGGRFGSDKYSGKDKQALQAGTYTIKANDNEFEPFEITIKDSETLTINKGGVL